MPPQSSRITVTYTYQGLPTITVAQSLRVAYVEGEICEAGGLEVVYETIVNETLWPWRDFEPCNSLGVRVRVCHSLSICSDEFTYTGEDVSVSLPVDEIAGVTLATARFLRDGIPQNVSILGWKYEVNGRVCSAGPTSAVFVPPAKVSVVTRFWPSGPGCDAQHVQVHFNTVEFGVLDASFEWDGASVEFDVETGASAQTTSPTPVSIGPGRTPVPTPAGLPPSGGPAPGSPSRLPILLFASLAGVVTIFVAVKAFRRGNET